jgi:3-oxoacyl-[acyl-carrier protein] reductase
MRDKVIVVSGGAGGIGAEVCARLASEGARVVVADLDEDRAIERAASIGGMDRALGVGCDITNPVQCELAADATMSAFGRLDGLVNCAGISKPHDSLTLPPAEWARMIDVQLSGAFYFTQACARRMANTGGAVVLITSTNAEAAFPRRAAYCCAKAGVAMLTKVLAIEWASLNIRVNAIGPAYVETDMTLRNIAAGNVSEEQIKARIPLGRLARPADVADGVSFLLSEKASFITGHSLYVDGGWLAYGYF